MIVNLYRLIQVAAPHGEGADRCVVACWWDVNGRALAGPMCFPGWVARRLYRDREQGMARTLELVITTIREWPAEYLGRSWCREDVSYVQDCGPCGLQLAHRSESPVWTLSGLDRTSLFFDLLWDRRREPVSALRKRAWVASCADAYEKEYLEAIARLAVSP